MYRGPHGVLHLLSASFKAFVLSVCPEITEPSYMERGDARRQYDFVEVFSGRAHLTEQLRDVLRLHHFAFRLLKIYVFALDFLVSHLTLFQFFLAGGPAGSNV